MLSAQDDHLLTMHRLINGAAITAIVSRAWPVEWDADLNARIARGVVMLIVRAAHLKIQAVPQAAALGYQPHLASPDIISAASGFIIIRAKGHIETESSARTGKTKTEAPSNFSIKSSQSLLLLLANGKQAVRKGELAPARFAIFSADREISIQAQVQTGSKDLQSHSHLMIVLLGAFSKIIIAIDAEYFVPGTGIVSQTPAQIASDLAIVENMSTQIHERLQVAISPGRSRKKPQRSISASIGDCVAFHMAEIEAHRCINVKAAASSTTPAFISPQAMQREYYGQREGETDLIHGTFRFEYSFKLQVLFPALTKRHKIDQ